ncbi:MAG: hypothetical protein WCW66_00810 [Patescibacteria group bacterium]
MKIVICGSMSSAVQMLDIEKELLKHNHEVILPKHTKEYAEMGLGVDTSYESIKDKIEQDLIRDYFEEIKKADAVLIVNVDKNGIHNYIGGNAFLEMGFAHCLNKTIFMLNNIPDMFYSDEILAMQPITLNGDLAKI